MKVHEKEHCDFFEKEIKKRNIKPTKLLPLWDILGIGLGFGTTILGKKAAMLCTASVEEVIDEHYLNQIKQLNLDEKKLKEKINSMTCYKTLCLYQKLLPQHMSWSYPRQDNRLNIDHF